MTKITIKRPFSKIIFFRNIELYLDHQKMGIIKNGEQLDFIVEPGEHILKAKIDWCGSREIKFNSTANYHFSVSISKYNKVFMITSLAFLIIHYLLKWVFDIHFFYWIFVATFMGNLYYLTLGRNQYLEITKK